MNSLPLSWSICETKTFSAKSITKWNVDWLAIRQVTSQKLLDNNFDIKGTAEEIIIRGCNTKIKNELEYFHYSSMLVGYEAILDTNKNPFQKRSIRDLIRRGKRFGKVYNIPHSPLNRQKLRDFQKVSSHGTEPQLKNLFQMEFSSQNLLYAFLDKNNNWLGALLLSQNSNEKLHLELLLRKKNAPIGVMEVLLEFAFLEAKNSKFKYLSLGELPFVKSVYQNGNLYSKLLFIIGKSLSFAYNHEGLYNFKNKFNPTWSKVYICASKKVSLKHLFFMIIHSNFHRLVGYKLLYRIKNKLYPLFLHKEKKNCTTRLDFNKT